MLRTTVVLLCLVSLLASGSLLAQNAAVPVAPPASADLGVPVTSPGYRLAADDVLQITIWGEPSISNVYMTVTPEGFVNAPVVGSIHAAGLTVQELRDEIAKRFVDMEMLKNPIIQLTVYQLHKMRVRVLGQVQRPGLQLMRDGDQLDQAVAEAGGFVPDSAGLGKATITRVGSTEPIPVNLEAFYFNGDLSQNMALKDGDTIYIPEDTENRFYVLGHVQQPRMFPLKPTTTVTEAITQAGGPQPRGALSRTVVIRKAVDGKPSERIAVNVTKILESGDTTQDIRLMAGDVVMVPETKSPDLAKIGQAFGALANIAYLSRIGLF